MDQMHLSYAAGFLDGEGSVGVYRDHHRRTRSGNLRAKRGDNHAAVLQASGYDRMPLDRLVALFGGRISPGRSRTGHTVYHWRLMVQDAVEMALRALLPHLTVKGAQAALTLRFLEWRRSAKRTNGPRAERSLDPWEVAEAESFADALKALKREEIEWTT